MARRRLVVVFILINKVEVCGKFERRSGFEVKKVCKGMWAETCSWAKWTVKEREKAARLVENVVDSRTVDDQRG